LAETQHSGNQPTVIVARTIKGRGVSFLENREGWHGRALNQEEARKAIEEIGGPRNLTIDVHKPTLRTLPARPPAGNLDLPRYEVGDSVATRTAYGDALEALGKARSDVVALDGEVSNSTYAEKFAHAFPERFFEMYIAEQQMVAAAVGMSVRNVIPFASSFAAFVPRASA